jgi:hypothetical protein
MAKRATKTEATTEATIEAEPEIAAPETFDSWAVVELMGHVRMAGRLTEVELFGSKLARIDIPNGRGGFTTQFFTAQSVYRITPTTEELARRVTGSNQAPIHRYELGPAHEDLDED